FVADFLGVSNLMSVTAHGEQGGRARLSLGDFELQAAQGDLALTGETKVVIRPERVHLESQDAAGENRVPRMVNRIVDLGSANQVIVPLATGETIRALVQNTGEEHQCRQGDPVRVHMPAEALRVLTDTGVAAIDEAAAVEPAEVS